MAESKAGGRAKNETGGAGIPKPSPGRFAVGGEVSSGLVGVGLEMSN